MTFSPSRALPAVALLAALACRARPPAPASESVASAPTFAVVSV